MTMYADTTKPPRTMTRYEQLLLLRTTGQRFDGYRDHVLLSLALATGMREHELVALNVGDVSPTAPRCVAASSCEASSAAAKTRGDRR